MIQRSLSFPSRPSAIITKILIRRPLTVIEIGVSMGANAFDMLKHMNIKRIYLVDPYKYEDSESDQHRIYGNLNKYKEDAIRTLKKYEDRITYIYQPFNFRFIPEKVDYIYIDGDHSTKAVISDIDNSLKVIRNGGIIGGHDLHYKSVKDAVIKCFGNKYHSIGIDWWIKIDR